MIELGEEIAEGTSIVLVASGQRGVVGRLLGAGGQGAAYLVEVGDAAFVLKWYHPHIIEADRRLRVRLERAVERGSPHRRFLWPIDLVEIPGQDGFGHLMPLRPPGFENLRRLIAAPPDRIEPSLRIRAAACTYLAESFLQLHARGLCYQDLNWGAFFLDPTTGQVCICDNDNVDVNGAPASVHGTRKFMAPEILRGEALPDAGTDLWSMAVLFFYILHSWHPLEGKAEHEIAFMDEDSEMALYGTAPRFIFDPGEPGNGPVAGFHDPIERRWRSLSGLVRRLFLRAFTTGLRPGPGRRVVETEWRTAMARLHDSVVTCPRCGFEHAIDAEDGDPCPSGFSCLACTAPIVLPLQLRIGRDTLTLERGARLFPHHIEPGIAITFEGPVGAVEPRPADAAVLGLRNLTARTWSWRLPGGGASTVPPAKAVRLVEGLELDFGPVRGAVTTPPTVAGRLAS